MRGVLACVFAALALFALYQVAANYSRATLSSGAASSPSVESAQPQLMLEQMDLMPMAFTENKGQWDDRVKFRANAGGATIWFTVDGVFYQFTRRLNVGQEPGASPHTSGHPDILYDRLDHKPDSTEQLVIKASFVGSNPNPVVVGEGLTECRYNYFIGNDPDSWHTDVPNYKAVYFKDVYAGIDLKYYGNGRQMEYDFIVSPGADPSQIVVQYGGAKSLSVNEAGELVVETDWNEVREQRPVIYQVAGNDRREIAGSYALLSASTFGFTLSAGYDETLPVVIDPSLVYSTYLGGSNREFGCGIAVDGSGCAYVSGYVYSTDFPTDNPYQPGHAGGFYDVFVTKLNASGDGLVYSTYLGGSDYDWGYDIAIDGSGCAYVTGKTWGSDYPTQGEYQTDQGGPDAFVTKLSSSGDSLVYSTYLGGSDDDRGYGLAVDSSECVYVTGNTWSSDFPTHGQYQSNQAKADAFVTKLNASGDGLVYSTYLGGSQTDYGECIAVNGSGCAYVTGSTKSLDFPTENPCQPDHASEYLYDAFVTKLSSSGGGLVYSTYLGGSGEDMGCGVAVDGSGCAYVTGNTLSSDFPTQGEYQTDLGSTDAFVTKLTSSGDGLSYSTYLGGDNGDWGYGIAIDGLGLAYVTGTTGSTDFPTQEEVQGYQGELDAFAAVLTSSCDGLVYSTFLGGSDDEDGGNGIAVDGSGRAYVTGYTYSSDFPTQGEYQIDQVEGDVFVAVFGDFSTAADDEGSLGSVPSEFTLGQNYPNPFNPTTTIEFYLSRATNVELDIHNVLGQRVRHIDLGLLGRGQHSTVWDGKDDTGHQLSSGLYPYRVKAGSQTQSKKMILLK